MVHSNTDLKIEPQKMWNMQVVHAGCHSPTCPGCSRISPFVPGETFENLEHSLQRTNTEVTEECYFKFLPYYSKIFDRVPSII